MTSDTLGTPRALTKADGSIRARHDYLPFGEELYADAGSRTTDQGYDESSTPEDTTRQKFTTYERDVETGLDYAQARYYAGGHGSFTSADPLLASGVPANPKTWNRYAYSLNNPLRFSDPTGLRVCPEAECSGRNDDDWLRESVGDDPEAQEQGENADLLEPPITLGNVIYEPMGELLGSGVVRWQDLSQVPAIDLFVNVTDYFASFTMRIVDRSTGENRTDYSYEISYQDDELPENAVTGRQTVAGNGLIEIGKYKVRSRVTGPDQPIEPWPPGNPGDIQWRRTGSITIYGTNGERVGTTRFEATLKTIDAAVADFRIYIIETH